VIDACVFPYVRRWLDPIVLNARDEHVILMWSPSIIAEANRILIWLWIKRHQQELTDTNWHLISRDAHRMFSRLTQVFRVVDDRPPPEESWSEQPPDEWDIPLWTAAVRGRADFIVTENLRDGPSPDSSGVRHFRGVVYLHPDQFIEILSWLTDLRTTPRALRLIESEGGEPEYTSEISPSPEVEAINPTIRTFFVDLLTRPKD
jgi:hypothetical protein